MDAQRFYDDIAESFHLVYADWPASIALQAQALSAILERELGPGRLRIRDVACGIGTQTLGLQALGHELVASDLSPGAIARARREAESRRLPVPFRVADMREPEVAAELPFDAVIAADNAVPHLLSDADLLDAFRAFHRKIRAGGALLITVRDYSVEDRGASPIHPFGVRVTPEGRCIVFQVWDWDPSGTHYDLAMYFVHERERGESRTLVSRARYYAVSTETLLELLRKAGFTDARRIDGEFFQPVLLARRP